MNPEELKGQAPVKQKLQPPKVIKKQSPPMKIPKPIKYCLLFLLFSVLLLAALIGSMYYTHENYTGTFLHAHAKYGEVQVYRNDYNIPTIIAKNQQGAFYGLGRCHAKDRLWQMTLRRLVTQGRVSSFAGRDALNLDIFWQSMELPLRAAQIEQTISAESKAALQAYVNGINDFVAALAIKPIEYYVLGVSFEPWTINDVISFGMMMSFSLNYNYFLEPIRTQLASVFTETIADYILPARSDAMIDLTSIMNEEELRQTELFDARFAQFVRKEKENPFQKGESEGANNNNNNNNNNRQAQAADDLLKNSKGIHDSTGGGTAGSNSWAVNGNFTFYGGALLANDPHLDSGMPSAWYPCELIYADADVLGGTLPGIPSVLIGRNQNIGWSTTVLYSDTTDLYSEKLLPNNQYEVDGKPRDLQLTPQEVVIKGESEPFKFTLRKTHRGPLIETLVNSAHPEQIEKLANPVSLRWTGFEENDQSIEAMIHLPHQRKLNDFLEMRNQLDTAAIATLFATSDNQIGFRATGRFPIRNKPTDGVYITDGTKSENDWQGFYDRSENPEIVNPKKGYIVANNNKFAHDGLSYGRALSATPTARAKRTVQLLERKILSKDHKTFMPQDMQKIQLDVHDSYAQVAVPQVVKLAQKFSHLSSNPTMLQKVLQTLEGWNYHFSVDSAQAAIYTLFDNDFRSQFFVQYRLQQKLSENDLKIVHGLYNFDNFIIKLLEALDARADDIDAYEHPVYKMEYCLTPENTAYKKNACLFNLVSALTKAGETLSEKYGSNPYDWKYGNIHTYRLPHVPFSRFPALQKLFDREFAAPGNQNTINVCHHDTTQDDHQRLWSPNMRIVFDMREQGQNFLVLDSGMSERFYSQHYDDQLELHQTGQYIQMRLGQDKLSQYTQLETLSYLGEDQAEL